MARPEPAARWCEELYAAKAAELLLYGRALGLSHGEAEDVLHDVFRQLLALAEAPKEPAFYAVRAFRNRALNHRRSLWRRVAREFESARWFEREADPSPAEQEALRCLTDLPAEQREVIVLKLWHGLTFEAIGEATGVSPNTAAGRYRYGIGKLRACLKGQAHERLAEPGERTDFAAAPAALGAS
ncbi:MAG: RNA polymerase sigma factor [Limisphaerales bacterium]